MFSVCFFAREHRVHCFMSAWLEKSRQIPTVDNHRLRVVFYIHRLHAVSLYHLLDFVQERSRIDISMLSVEILDLFEPGVELLQIISLTPSSRWRGKSGELDGAKADCQTTTWGIRSTYPGSSSYCLTRLSRSATIRSKISAAFRSLRVIFRCYCQSPYSFRQDRSVTHSGRRLQQDLSESMFVSLNLLVGLPLRLEYRVHGYCSFYVGLE